MLSTKLCFSLSRSKADILSRHCFNWREARWQSNAACPVIESPLTSDLEWQQARPFNEMPALSPFAMMRLIMPGGKFYKTDTMDILREMIKANNGIFYLKRFSQPGMVVTSNPDDFERIFRHEGVWPERPGPATLTHYRLKHRKEFFKETKGFSVSQGEAWFRARTAINPILMQHKNVLRYMPQLSEVNAEFLERIREIRDPQSLEVPANFEQEIKRFTLESIALIVLDQRLGLIKQSRVNPDALQLMNDLITFFTLAPQLDISGILWRYVPTPKFKRLMAAFDSMLAITGRFTDVALKRLEAEERQGIERRPSERSLLEKLLKVDKPIATILAMDMLIAGVETSKNTFAAMLLCLATNPDKQAKLNEEMRRIMPRKDSDFTEASLKDIPYFRACFKEALRFHPLFPGNSRAANSDLVLGGYRVPKGTRIFLLTMDTMLSEEYFTDSKVFRPERWLRPSGNEESEFEKLKNPFAYLPFGYGPRMCVGKRIGELELQMSIARIIRNYKVEFNYPTEKAFKTLLANVTNIPLKFKFIDIED